MKLYIVAWVSQAHNSTRKRKLTEITNKLLRVIINESTFLNSLFDGGEIRVGKDHISSKFSDISPAPHSYTDVRFLQSRGIIYTITSLQDMKSQFTCIIDGNGINN